MEKEEKIAELHGVYEYTNEEYHSGPGVSRSALLELNRSPLHYWYHYLNPDKPRHQPPPIIKVIDALDFGNALHTYILEPELFDEQYEVIEPIKRNTKAGKIIYEEALDRIMGTGKLLICESAHNAILKTYESVKKDPYALDLIRGAQFEKSIYWVDQETGIQCKVRPDIWQPNFIGDLKTAANASEKAFGRAIYDHGYYIQAAMIREGFKFALGIEMNNFCYIVVEKEPPFACAIYSLDEHALNIGQQEFYRLLEKLKFYQDKDKWPSYPTKTLTLPSYALK